MTILKGFASLLLLTFQLPALQAKTMEPVVWDNSNAATVIFCEDGNGNYGYKLDTDTSSDCDPAGVLIRMNPGVNYKLTLQNDASVETNIHTHGLHLSGSGNADDPRRKVDADMCLVYHWDIPADHMGGTFWAHAHVHTRTQEQVEGGAFIMLIIEENTDTAVIYDPDMSVGSTEMANIEAWYQNELLLVASKVGNTVLGNGMSNYEIDMNKDEWYRMRIVAVDPSRSNDLVFSDACTVHAVAHDGVWRFQVPKETASNTYPLSGASRLDVAIRCSSNAVVNFGGKNKVVATLKVGSPSGSSATPFKDDQGSSWASYRPTYLRDLRNTPPDRTYGISMSAAQINGVSYDPFTPLGTWQYDTVQEWTISGTNAHPYHLHVYHMQAIDCGNGLHDAGEYYDVINVNGDCIVRFHMIDVAESIMMHCHFLAHEDNGSMTWAKVEGGPVQSDEDRDQMMCPGSTPSPVTDAPTPGPVTDAPTPAPVTDAPTISPGTDAPTPTPVCTAAGDPCRDDEDCCSGSCARGKPSARTCLSARNLLRKV